MRDRTKKVVAFAFDRYRDGGVASSHCLIAAGVTPQYQSIFFSFSSIPPSRRALEFGVHQRAEDAHTLTAAIVRSGIRIVLGQCNLRFLPEVARAIDVPLVERIGPPRDALLNNPSIVDHTVCSTPSSQRTLRAAGLPPERVSFIPNCAPTHFASSVTPRNFRKELCLSKESQIVLVMGRLEPRKGIHRVPEILESLPEYVHCVVVGGPWVTIKHDTSEYVRRLRAVGYPRLHFVGTADGTSDSLSCIAGADFTLIPSDPGYEGIPNTALESAAVGHPVVATAFDGMELFGDGVVPSDGSEQDLARRCSKLLDGSERSRRAAAIVAAACTHLSPVAMAHRYLTLFKKLTSSGLQRCRGIS